MWNFRDMEEWAGFPLLDAILLLHQSLGLMSEFSPAFLLLFSPLLRSVLNTTKLALTNFLEGPMVHRFLSVHGLWSRRYYGTFSSWFDFGYPLVSVFESIFRSRLVPSSIGLILSTPSALGFLACQVLTALGILVLLRRDSLFVDVLSSVWPKRWHAGATPLFELSKMREVAFNALVQRTLHPPRILRNPVSGGESPALSSTASPQVSSSGASLSAWKRSSASPSGPVWQDEEESPG